MMNAEKDKKKRSSSKSKEASSLETKDDKKSTSKDRSSSKDRTKTDEKSSKNKEISVKKEMNGHVNDKERKSRDESKPKIKDKERRDESKSKTKDSSERKSESKERKKDKNDSKDKPIALKVKKDDKHVVSEEKNDKKPKRRDDDKKLEDNSSSMIPTIVKEKRKKSAKKPKSAENGHVEDGKIVPDDGDEFNYEEDFEDYEEDFEDDEDEDDHDDHEKSINNRQRSDSESEKDFEEVTKREIVNRPDTPEESKPTKIASENGKKSPETRPPTVQSRIDFSKAKYSEIQMQSYGKVSRRNKELLNLIELDATNYDLFDLAPIRDYEFFMQNFGKSNMKQVQLQTDDDAVDREIQSNEIEVENKWSQHPPTDLSGCGGDQMSTAIDNDKKFQIDTELLNSTKFRRFIEKNGKLIFELLEEESTSSSPSFQNKSNLSFSDGYSSLSLGFLSKQCKTSFVLIPPDNSHLLLTAFFIEQSPAEDLVNKGIICVWNINNLETPQKLLLCDSEVKCACFSPDVPSTVFAGLNDGSIALYDLHESAARHKTIPWKNDEIPLRIPTYNTAYLSRETEENVINPVKAIVPLGNASRNAPGQSTNSSSYQIAVLEEMGIITIWTVLTTTVGDHLEFDFGLSPNGRLKLVKSATLKPSSGSVRKSGGNISLKSKNYHSFCLGNSFGRPSDFYVGTDSGFIVHMVRQENKSGPSVYKPELEAISDVLCLNFSPFEPSVLLAGMSDGSICLYKINFTKPLGVFHLSENLEPVRSVQWSPRSPYMFYSLHGQTTVAIWDLKHNKQAPIQVEKTKQLNSMSISSWVHSDDQSNSKTYIIFACIDGTAEVHCVKNSSSSKYNRSDGQKLLGIVERL